MLLNVPCVAFAAQVVIVRPGPRDQPTAGGCATFQPRKIPVPSQSIEPQAAEITAEQLPGGDGDLFVARGDWRNHGINAAVLDSLATLEAADAGGAVHIDVTGLADIDTTGAWLLRRLMTAKQSQGREVALVGADRALKELIAVPPEQAPVPATEASAGSSLFERVFAPFGKLVWELGSDFLSAMHILGSEIGRASCRERVWQDV